MKFEIDLNEILQDEDGHVIEDLQQSVKRQIIEKLTAEVSKGIKKQINEEVAKVLQEQLKLAVTEQMPKLLDDLMNTEYWPVNQWGTREEKPTTFRAAIIKATQEQMVYKKTNYASDQNVFTRAVDAVIAENVKEMQKDFDKRVIEMFQKEAFEYAMKKMSEKLGVKV